MSTILEMVSAVKNLEKKIISTEVILVIIKFNNNQICWGVFPKDPFWTISSQHVQLTSWRSKKDYDKNNPLNTLP